MEDNHSIASGGSTHSATNQKQPCNFCSSDFQIKSLFNHIRTKHPKQFEESLCSSWLKKAEAGKPIAVFYDIEDDRGEQDTLIIYGCLSSNKCFLTESRALAHFKKNPKDLKEHNKLLLQYKKRVKEIEKEQKADPYRSRFQTLASNNDPELCRNIWSAILHYQEVVKLVMELVQYLSPQDSSITNAYGDKWKTLTVEESLNFWEKLKADINKEFQAKCLVYIPLINLFQRLQRLLEFRTVVEFHHEFYFKTPSNKNGMLLSPTDEFGFYAEGMPRVNF